MRNWRDFNKFLAVMAKFYLDFESPDFAKREELGIVNLTFRGWNNKTGPELYDILAERRCYQPIKRTLPEAVRLSGVDDAGTRLMKAVKVRTESLGVREILRQKNIRFDDGLEILMEASPVELPLEIAVPVRASDAEYFII